jgi:hypothetical protein
MKKYFYLALVCLASVVTFTACNEKGNNNPDKDGSWYTSASQIDVTAFDDKDSKCWAIDIWCDGTTIGRQYEWGSEASVATAAKLILTMDYQVFGYQTKKVKWFGADANDEDACHAQVWEGAVCWEETVSYNGSQSETNFGWMPEANMKERHDYYESKGLTHTYKHADAADQDACEKLTPQNNPDDPKNPDEPKNYDQYDNTTYKCWKTTQTAYGMDIVNYVWMTERQLVEYYDQMGLTYTYEQADAADEDACNELKENSNPTEGEEACWQITSNIMGQINVTYYWGTESEAQAQVNAINGTGVGTASYTKAAANDPDACSALND